MVQPGGVARSSQPAPAHPGPPTQLADQSTAFLLVVLAVLLATLGALGAWLRRAPSEHGPPKAHGARREELGHLGPYGGKESVDTTTARGVDNPARTSTPPRSHRTSMARLSPHPIFAV